ncbi:MAG TPA: ribosome silencing factor [Azoarcus sp.]|nr:ribosome silencing factor [Azoarcus sp.]
MNLAALEKTVVDALQDVKAHDIEVFDTTTVTPLFDRVIVASAESNRQTRALARHVQAQVKEAGSEVISVEGEDNGEWILVDLADIIVHIMQPAVRKYYNIEELWSAKPSDIPKSATGN